MRTIAFADQPATDEAHNPNPSPCQVATRRQRWHHLIQRALLRPPGWRINSAVVWQLIRLDGQLTDMEIRTAILPETRRAA